MNAGNSAISAHGASSMSGLPLVTFAVRMHCRAMDGALGFWAALREVFGSTAEQRCWLHKTGNVLKGAIGSSPMDDAEIRAGQSQRPPT